MTRTQLPVVCRSSFLQVMEVARRGLVVVCFFWKRMVVKAASRQPTTAIKTDLEHSVKKQSTKECAIAFWDAREGY